MGGYIAIIVSIFSMVGFIAITFYRYHKSTAISVSITGLLPLLSSSICANVIKAVNFTFLEANNPVVIFRIDKLSNVRSKNPPNALSCSFGYKRKFYGHLQDSKRISERHICFATFLTPVHF